MSIHLKVVQLVKAGMFYPAYGAAYGEPGTKNIVNIAMAKFAQHDDDNNVFAKYLRHQHCIITCF